MISLPASLAIALLLTTIACAAARSGAAPAANRQPDGKDAVWRAGAAGALGPLAPEPRQEASATPSERRAAIAARDRGVAGRTREVEEGGRKSAGATRPEAEAHAEPGRQLLRVRADVVRQCAALVEDVAVLLHERELRARAGGVADAAADREGGVEIRSG